MTDNGFEAGQLSWKVKDDRNDPVAISKDYYDRAIVNLRGGALSDGLMDLCLSEAHIIGEYAPKHKPIDPEKVPLLHTLGHLIFMQREARRQLLKYGPGKQLEPRHIPLIGERSDEL